MFSCAHSLSEKLDSSPRESAIPSGTPQYFKAGRPHTRIRPATPLHQATSKKGPTQSLRQILVIIKDAQLLREGIIEILRQHFPEFQLHIDEYDSGRTDQANPDLIITSIGEKGSEVTPDAPSIRLTESFPNVPVLLISEDDDRNDALYALQNGFAGFFPSTQSAEMLTAAIRLILAGGRFYPPDLIDRNFVDRQTGPKT